MACNFVNISIDGTVYTASSPIEAIPANQATLQAFLDGLDLGTFQVIITSSSLRIFIIQSEHVINYFTTSNPTATYNFSPSNCASLETDINVYCDYTLTADSDPSDQFIYIVVDSIVYQPSSPILASDVAAVQAYLDSEGLNYITYNNTGGLYVIAELTNHRISYMRLLRGGSTTVDYQFLQTSCRIPVRGCMNPLANNYDPTAEIDDGSCIIGGQTYGCKDPNALNYDPDAEVADDSCLYSPLTPLQKLQCCAGEKAYQIALKENQGKKVCDCSYRNLQYIDDAIFIEKHYHPDSENTVIEVIPGYTAYAIIDLSPFGSFGNLTGQLIAAGTVIGTFGVTAVPDLPTLMTVLLNAVNTGPAGYTAEDAGSNQLKINAPNPASGAQGSTVTLIINPEYQANDLGAIDAWGHRQMIYVDDTNSAFYGKVIIAAQQYTAGFSRPYIRILDGATYTDVQLPVNDSLSFVAVIRCYSLCHDKVNDRIYVTGFNGKIKYSYITSNLQVGNLGNPYPGVVEMFPPSFNVSAYTAYCEFDNSKYFVAADGNMWKVDSSDVMTSLFVGTLTGANKLWINQATGEKWVLGSSSIFVIDSSNALIDTIAAFGTPKDITYISEPGNELVLVSSYSFGASIIRSYDPTTRAVVDATFYALGSTHTNRTLINYSETFNVVFAYSDVDTDGNDEMLVIATDKTLLDTIDLEIEGIESSDAPESYSMIDDPAHSRQLAAFSTNLLTWDSNFVQPFEIVFGNEGEEELEATFEGEVPPVITEVTLRPDDNCLTLEEKTNSIDNALELCANCCGDHDEDRVTDEIPEN